MKYVSHLKKPYAITGLLASVIVAGIIPLGMSPKQELYCKIFTFGLCIIKDGYDKI